tara:strand:- start:3100 stop:3957 length:858 start_codon:yes stop_codon:yes gene_type:complete
MPEEDKPTYSGHLLREARKKKRRRYMKLSSELGIPQKYLEALEKDDYSSMPSETYIRGYIRAYSKKLDLVPEVVLEAYDRYLENQRKEIKIENKEEKLKSNHKLIYSLVIVFILIFIYVLLFIILPNGEPADKISRESPRDLNQEMLDASQERVLDSMAVEESQNQERPIFKKEKEKIFLLPEEFKGNLIDEVKNFNRLYLSIHGDCWIEIMDKHAVLEYRLAKAGTSIEITGEGPFKVILGNVHNAQLFYNDEQINLSSTTNSVTNVSCLVLPTGRCSEFTLSN